MDWEILCRYGGLHLLLLNAGFLTLTLGSVLRDMPKPRCKGAWCRPGPLEHALLCMLVSRTSILGNPNLSRIPFSNPSILSLDVMEYLTARLWQCVWGEPKVTMSEPLCVMVPPGIWSGGLKAVDVMEFPSDLDLGLQPGHGPGGVPVVEQ